MDHIVNVVQKPLHIVSGGIVTSNLDEFTAGPSCRSATIREAGVYLLSVSKGGIQELMRYVRMGFHQIRVGSYLVGRYP